MDGNDDRPFAVFLSDVSGIVRIGHGDGEPIVSAGCRLLCACSLIYLRVFRIQDIFRAYVSDDFLYGAGLDYPGYPSAHPLDYFGVLADEASRAVSDYDRSLDLFFRQRRGKDLRHSERHVIAGAGDAVLCEQPEILDAELYVFADGFGVYLLYPQYLVEQGAEFQFRGLYIDYISVFYGDDGQSEDFHHVVVSYL